MRLLLSARAIALLLVLTLAPLAQAHGAGDDHAVTVDLAAAEFPTSDEVQAAIADVAGDPWFAVHSLGSSIEGRPLNIVVVTDPGSTVPMAERVVTLIETQQHGNEPAGTGAAIPLLRDLKAGQLRDLLDNQVLLLLPMSNPDGATANTRENNGGADINRDHIGLETPEARAISAILNQWDVHVAVDHHEYSGTGVGYPVPVRVYDWDLTTMAPNHGNVRQPTLDAANGLNDAVWAAAEAKGYSAGDYGWTTVNGMKVEQGAGGPDPGILRNAFGLNNVAGLLGETFVSALPDSPILEAQRRIDIHRTVMEATLRFAHENAASLIAAKRESERLNLEEPMAEYWEPPLGVAVDDPSTPEPTEIRSPMASAYRTSENLTDLFLLHGLPEGVRVAEGWVHNVHGEARGGLVAAMVHPDSSRGVADGVPTEAILAPADEDGGADEQVSPLGPFALVALALALVVVRRR